jgi:uncharacterized glyoxalase superfamily metalloenzyme YdcJ
MYAGEVGAYARLFELVLDVNRQVLGEQDDARADDAAELARLSAPRHGAIRIGRPDELALLARLFAQFGMQPVDFYDLVPAGLPVMSTAFRPVVTEDLEASPFRMFCSLLRPELIAMTGRRGPRPSRSWTVGRSCRRSSSSCSSAPSERAESARAMRRRLSHAALTCSAGGGGPARTVPPMTHSARRTS